MCVTSTVYDHYAKQAVWTAESIDEFKYAVERAKELDIILKQPDCVDLEKEKLLKKIACLEKKLKQKK